MIERNSLLLSETLFRSRRPADLLRSAMVRAAVVATVFGCSINAIAGDHDRTAVNPVSPGSPAQALSGRLSTARRLKQWFETGQASWYGLKFQGKHTATGEKFDMNTFTCAHRSLPLGSWLRVTNLRNRRSVLVRVNDRGPMVTDRIVDLSYAAANAVGLGGTGKVKLERVSLNDPDVARVLVAQMPRLPFSSLLAAQ